MIRLLEEAAAGAPDHVAVVTSEGTTTYGALLRDAQRIGAALHQRGLTRLAIVEPDAGWVLRLLAGAALAGCEPCQYQADIEAGEFADQAAGSGHDVVVTRRTDLDGTRKVVHPDELVGADASARVTPDGPSDLDQPVLIRTTGTTGRPKAARHDWHVLARTVEGVRPAPAQRWLLAYGPHQFAGIQVLLHVLAARATLVAPFPRQPRDGLRAIVEDHVTCVSATPTFWRFLLAEARSRKVTLPPLEQITLGGEASPEDLLVEIRAAFPGAKVSQVYASTEHGSIASVRDGKPGIPVASLYGGSNQGSNVRVVEGELWVRASAGMLGYADEAGAAPAGGGEWRPTGDLVEIVSDRVLFRGRTSEVINVGGVKVHPLPIEERITALEGVAAARVYGRPNKLTGAIVAAEIVPSGDVADADVAVIRAQVGAAVADLPRAWHPRSITVVETIETRGGKTVRGMED